MKKYEYVTVYIGKFFGAKSEEHRKIIDEYAAKEKSMVVGSSMKLADYYWGVVYLYSLKRLFTSEYEMISMDDLERTVLKGEKQ